LDYAGRLVLEGWHFPRDHVRGPDDGSSQQVWPQKFKLMQWTAPVTASVCRIGHKHRGGAAVGYFAGLDVSLEETAICIVDDTGQIVREARAVDPFQHIAELRGGDGGQSPAE
jgi:hypothetical protein